MVSMAPHGFQDFRAATRFSRDRTFSNYPRSFGQNREPSYFHPNLAIFIRVNKCAASVCSAMESYSRVCVKILPPSVQYTLNLSRWVTSFALKRRLYYEKFPFALVNFALPPFFFSISFHVPWCIHILHVTSYVMRRLLPVPFRGVTRVN